MHRRAAATCPWYWRTALFAVALGFVVADAFADTSSPKVDQTPTEAVGDFGAGQQTGTLGSALGGAEDQGQMPPSWKEYIESFITDRYGPILMRPGFKRPFTQEKGGQSGNTQTEGVAEKELEGLVALAQKLADTVKATSAPNRLSPETDAPVPLLSISVLAFGLIVLMCEMAIIWRSAKAWSPLSVRIVGLTLALTIGLFLIPAGYTEKQIAPLMGMLGTAVGFLFGQGTSITRNSRENSE